MIKLVFIFVALSAFCHCLIYIDRFTNECNSRTGNISIAFTHDKEGQSVTNVTICMFVTIEKLRVYIKINLKENQNDREYRREFIRTIIDVEKLTKGIQKNKMVKGFMEDLMKSMECKLIFPLKPVNLFINLFTCFDYNLLACRRRAA